MKSTPLGRIRDVGGRLQNYAKQGRDLGRALVAKKAIIPVAPAGELSQEQEQELPPVVSRLVIEIRSDGSRTLARGALEDVEHGQRVAIHAEGATPAELVGSLAKALLKAPWLALQQARTSHSRTLGRRSSSPDVDPAKNPAKR